MSVRDLSVSVAPGTVPPWLRDAAVVAAEVGTLALVVLCVALGVRALRAGRAAAVQAVAVAIGAVVAYLASEALKLLLAKPRPCHVEDRLAELAACPGLTDYAFPSNHATIAAALATAAALLHPRARAVGATLAVLVAVSRVVGGLHYVPDVLVGAVLGSVVVLLAGVSMRPHDGGGARRQPWRSATNSPYPRR